jgi:hypothetical protein
MLFAIPGCACRRLSRTAALSSVFLGARCSAGDGGLLPEMMALIRKLRNTHGTNHRPT